MKLNQDKIQRMIDGRGGVAGGGSSLDPGMIAGLATEAWTEENYVSKTFFNELFVIHKKTTTTVYDGDTVVITTTDTSGTFAPNEIPSQEESTDEETGYRTVVVTEVDNIEAKKGLWTDFFLSALGLNGSGGGGGIGDVTWQALGDNTDTRQIASSHLTTALGSALAGYATQSWVTSQNYVTSSAISDMATKTWVNNQSFVNWTALGDTTTTQQIALSHLTTALSTYATQSWVTSNFSTPSTVATQLQTYAKIQNGTITIGDTSLTPITSVTGTFWGKSFTNGGTVNGTIKAGTSGGAIEQFHSVEMNSAGTLAGYGGFIDFHYYASGSTFDSSLDYTSRIIESEVGVISILAKNNNATNANKLAGLLVGAGFDGSYVQIGDLRIVYDSTNNALKVVKLVSGSEVAANFYATGSVSALGYGSGGGGGTGDVTWTNLADNSDTRPIAISHIQSALSGYATTSQLAGYLPLSGGGTVTTTTGCGIVNSSTSIESTWLWCDSKKNGTMVHRASFGYVSGLAFLTNDQSGGRLGINDHNAPQFWPDLTGTTKYDLLHSGNVSTYLANYVTLNTAQTITALKTHTGGLRVTSIATSYNEGIVAKIASTGYAGLFLVDDYTNGTEPANALILSLNTLNISDTVPKFHVAIINSHSSYRIGFPLKQGTFALTSDIPTSLDQVPDGTTRKLSNYLSKISDDTSAYQYIFSKTGAGANCALAVGGTAVNISSSVSDQTSMLQLIAGSGGTTNSVAIGFHNPMVSSGVLEFRNTSSTAGYYNFRCDLTTWDVRIGGNVVWNAGNDGANSGLDADLLDGQHGSYYATAASLNNYLPLTGGTLTGTGTNGDVLTIASATTYTGLKITQTGIYWAIGVDANRSKNFYFYNTSANSHVVNISPAGQIISYIATGTSPFNVTSTTVNTNLNADLLDGQHASYFAASSALNNYLPLSGGTLTGTGTDGDVLKITSSSTNYVGIRFAKTGIYWAIGVGTDNGFYLYNTSANGQVITVSAAGQIISNITTGTSPFSVTSTTVNTNLNADLLDGQHSSYFATAASLNNYLPLTAGSSKPLTGCLLIKVSTANYVPALQINNYDGYVDTDDTAISQIKFGTETQNNQIGIGKSTRTYFGKKGFALHTANTSEFDWLTSNWTKLMALEASSGNLWLSGKALFGTLTPIDGKWTIPFTAVYAGLSNTGWVGSIGTSSGSVLLGFRGSVGIIGTSAAVNLEMMPDGGNLGIGTASPSYKLHVAGTFYASNTATFGSNVVSGTSGGAIEGFQSWELNTHNTAGTNIGGFLDFHYNGTAQDYSLRLMEKDYSGVLQILAKDTGTGNAQRAGLIVGAGTYTSFIQIGNGRIVWDNTNHALRIVDADGNACNLYATGGVSALGYQSGGGGGGSTGVFSTSITPDTTGTYDIGTSTYKWRNLYLAGANGGNGFSIITSYSSYVYIGSLNKILFGADVEFEDTAYVENRMGIGVKNGNYDLYVYGENEGNAYFAGDVSVASLTNRSDMRLKDVVGDVNLSVQQIASAPTFKFRFKEKAKRTMVGTSAQYWDAVLPESVTRDADGILGLDYGVTALVSTIILAKGMTEHERRITKLEKENAELRARIKDLEEN